VKVPRRGEALTPLVRLRAVIAPGPAVLLRQGFAPDTWQRWDEEFGPAFRLKHGIAKAGDAERYAQGDADVLDELPLPPPNEEGRLP
jgi:hypothetical protein